MPFDYLTGIKKQFSQYKLMGEKTIGQLKEEDLFWQYNQQSNSIAIIVQHLSGNMISRWTNFLTGDGEKEWRDRDTEFETSINTREDLLSKWNAGWECLLSALGSLTSDDLSKTVYIRKEPISVMDAINRQLAHYCSHLGQIVYIGKMRAGDQWQTLSIPKRGSKAFNEKMKTDFLEKK